jgi:hypothetical protein
MKGVSVRAGVDFTDARADPRRRFDLCKFGIDEDTGHDSGVGESGNHIPQALFLSHNIESALRCHLMATFRNEHRHLRLERTGNTDHFIGCRHLQIQLDLRRFTQAADIGILNVPTVFAQMHRNAIGTTQMSLHGGPDWIRFIRATRLADGCNVVDIDAQFDHSSCISLNNLRVSNSLPAR